MNHRKFLSEFFGDMPDKSFINIWTLPSKQSKFFSSPGKASKYVDSILKEQMDVFYGAGAHRRKQTAGGRGKKIDIIGIPGFWIDIDFQTKDKPNCPPTLKDALKLIEGYGWDPTIIVHTGHGIHAYWKFKEFWEFKNEAETQKAEMLNRRLQATVQARALEQNWKLDSTHDVTRVMRLIGTTNYKDPANPVQTKLQKNSGKHYSDPDDFDQLLLAEDQINISQPIDEIKKVEVVKNLTLDPMAEPPVHKLDALIDIDPKFAVTWKSKRKDLKSPSEYAMSLANFAADAEWTDQEIADLIVAFYRRHKYNMKKAMRPDYVASTIIKAKDSIKEQGIKNFEENIAPLQGTKYGDALDPGGLEAKKTVNDIVRPLQILKITQFEQEDLSHYRVYTSGKKNTQIPFKDTKQLMTKNLFRLKVFEKTRLWIPPIKDTHWEIVRKNLGLFMQVIDSGWTTTQLRMKDWIEAYLDNKPTLTMDESLSTAHPFIYNGYWWVYDKPFRNWTWTNYGNQSGIEKTDLDLTIIGATQNRFDRPHPDKPGARKKIIPWKIPHDISIPPAPQIKK